METNESGQWTVVQNAAQVALEAGNSPQSIFWYYHELVRAMNMEEWFGITPEIAKAAKNARRDGAAGKLAVISIQGAA